MVNKQNITKVTKAQIAARPIGALVDDSIPERCIRERLAGSSDPGFDHDAVLTALRSVAGLFRDRVVRPLTSAAALKQIDLAVKEIDDLVLRLDILPDEILLEMGAGFPDHRSRLLDEMAEMRAQFSHARTGVLSWPKTGGRPGVEARDAAIAAIAEALLTNTSGVLGKTAALDLAHELFSACFPDVPIPKEHRVA